ncbi:glycosyltransferase family 9 protein [Niveibacterium sp. 24ML]|uniref:glycosyltransferase family 9 protein n=1 Tax=Niveibacterium sp. 24ML TaxID=2985512 RepID=UPI002271051D|nr:glycosyltransferase family 9 protein [Niveibacterium sp. 24ML]MCX9154710.1 glycosyltransferase family 9 protein [Niveibacterium sp. 24ML]
MTSILIIRRDNIGDLVCTTPLISALRQRFPDARIDALVNSYNLPVVMRSPDLDEVFAYTKTHHRVRGSESALGVLWKRARLMFRLRQRKYDYVILANGGCMARPVRLARLIQPKHVIGFTEAGNPLASRIDMGVPVERRPEHESEEIFRLLEPLGITGKPGPLVVRTDADLQAGAQRTLNQQPWRKLRPTLAVHISARLPSQRWPAEHFIEALRNLAGQGEYQFMLFWSPGDEKNPMHPGDDGKARQIIDALGAGFPLLPWPSTRLDELMAGLAICDGMLCSDGGAMHLGAALGLPMAVFFGESDATRWYPWGVPHEILQPESRKVAEVPASAAIEALARLKPAMHERATARGAIR